MLSLKAEWKMKRWKLMSYQFILAFSPPQQLNLASSKILFSCLKVCKEEKKNVK